MSILKLTSLTPDNAKRSIGKRVTETAKSTSGASNDATEQKRFVKSAWQAAGNVATASYTALAAGPTSTSGGGFGTNRYAPNLETLDKQSYLDDITPKSDTVLMQLFEMIYEKDAVAGPATDLISTLPWSDWTLSGIKDPAIMHIYEDAMEMFDPVVTMPELTREYMSYGKFISSLVYDSNQGTWRAMIPHNPRYCTITPVPIRGLDPVIDVSPSPEMSAFLESKDKRFDAGKALVPDFLKKGFKNGAAPLDPFSTLFVPRKVTTLDWKGTSMFMRILPYYAIEKALVQSTISSARRRTRSILHLSCGREGQWEPEQFELDEITSLFQASEEDPVGAIIATREGIQANEVRSGGDFWKISEEADFLKTAKLNAFGLSESFLTGEASYNTMEASMSVFIESIKVLRANLEKRVFEDKVFDVLARHHGFVRRKEADRAHGVRTSLPDSGHRSFAGNDMKDALAIPKRTLQLPTIHWTKNLSPTADTNYIEMLKSLQEQGLPITMKRWASAGGLDLTDLENSLEEDKAIRERFKKYKPAPAQGEGGDGGEGGGFGAFSSFVDTDALTVLGSFADHEDHKQGTFFGVPYKVLRAFALDLTSSNKKMRTLRDDAELSSYLSCRLDGNLLKINAAKYMLVRMNIARAFVSDSFVEALANKLSIAIASSVKSKPVLRALKHEVEILAAVHEASKPRKRNNKTTLASVLRAEISRNNRASTSINNIYAGV